MAAEARRYGKLPTEQPNPASRRIGPTGLVISDPLPGNIIPQNQMNASAVALQALLPLPNFGAPGALSRNYFYGPPRSSNTYISFCTTSVVSPRDL